MKIINPSCEILSRPDNVLIAIERAARTCYKSEDKISKGSAERLVRTLIRRRHMAMIEFGGDIVVKFITDRGFTHEMVRHRLGSFAQESTRYCNYGRGKFGQEITCIDPRGILTMRGLDPEAVNKARGVMIRAWHRAEAGYMELLEMGAPPEIARNILPIGLKTEIVVKANVREWRHIFSQRASKAAHPRMRELMIPLLQEVKRFCPVVFDDIATE